MSRPAPVQVNWLAYPGTCRNGLAAGRSARAWRLRVDATEIAFADRLQGRIAQVLERDVADAALDEVRIYFPDPWHKKRHNKRRLIQAPLVAHLTSRLAPGGYVHCATDWEPYAQQMLEVLSAEPGLVNTADTYAEKPAYRPLTKFENRGLRLGHGVWDLVFRKRA